MGVFLGGGDDIDEDLDTPLKIGEPGAGKERRAASVIPWWSDVVLVLHEANLSLERIDQATGLYRTATETPQGWP